MFDLEEEKNCDQKNLQHKKHIFFQCASTADESIQIWIIGWGLNDLKNSSWSKENLF